MNRFLFLIVLASLFSFSASQDPPDDKSETLKILSLEHRNDYDQRKSEAVEYAVRNRIPLARRLEDGSFLELQYIDEKGLPVYFKTFNAGAAATVNTNQLHPGGGLGLELTGKGYPVGVWDAGIVDSFHVEFKGRLFQKNTFTEPDDHATHVAGTIAATGINKNAKGMAFESLIYSYNWNNYLSEVAAEAADGLLISNHSYGIALGWIWDNGEWKWYGDPEALKEYRFGFYSENQSRRLDQIAWNAPEFLMVWSAGNSRSGEGDGTKEPNGPYDCIGPEGIAKNVLAVGAVQKIPGGYTGPSDVRMTTFSSWGPADDGRVKPDLVAPGQNIFSTTPFNNYQNFSGTSMSAPVTAGSLILLQELYDSLNGGGMRSATLKGLALHSVNETGENKGPDYSFGWGLLNTAAAAEIITRKDGKSVWIEELTMNENEAFGFEFYSDGVSDVIATIAWTDPPGTPMHPDSIIPFRPMLVNDLDIRIRDEAGNVYYPWILDPVSPEKPAVTGDNYRDNIEKIHIENAAPRKYSVSITHKDTLVGGRQDFSLILSASVIDPSETATVFWVGGEGDWDDPRNWSLSSGGEPAEIIPDPETNVIFDENSFSDSLQMLNPGSDARCRSFSWLIKTPNPIGFNGREIRIYENLLVSTSIFGDDTDGRFIFEGSSGVISTGDSSGNPYNFVFDNEDGEWHILSDISIRSLELKAGSITIPDKRVYIDAFISDGEVPKYLEMLNTQLYLSGIFDLTGDGLEVRSEGVKVIISLPESENRAVLIADYLEIESVEIFKGILELVGNLQIESLFNSAAVVLDGSNNISGLFLEKGSETWLAGGSVQTLSGFSIMSAPDSMVLISSLSEETASLVYNEYVKLCFENIIVDNVVAGGDAVFVAGVESQLSGTTEGWIERPCDEVLFARFSVEFPCVSSTTGFTDLSDGNIDNWLWNFGTAPGTGNTSTLQNPVYTYTEPGQYNIRLSISDPYGTTQRSREIAVIENTLPPNEILESSLQNRYISSVNAPNYQWYIDDKPIAGANERRLARGDYTGRLSLIIWDESCNRVADMMVVSTEEVEAQPEGMVIYPNPAAGMLTVELNNSYMGALLIEIFDIGGRIVNSFNYEKPDRHFRAVLDTGGYSPGYYLVRIKSETDIIVRSFVKY